MLFGPLSEHTQTSGWTETLLDFSNVTGPNKLIPQFGHFVKSACRHPAACSHFLFSTCEFIPFVLIYWNSYLRYCVKQTEPLLWHNYDHCESKLDLSVFSVWCCQAASRPRSPSPPTHSVPTCPRAPKRNIPPSLVLKSQNHQPTSLMT